MEFFHKLVYSLRNCQVIFSQHTKPPIPQTKLDNPNGTSFQQSVSIQKNDTDITFGSKIIISKKFGSYLWKDMLRKTDFTDAKLNFTSPPCIIYTPHIIFLIINFIQNII